MPREPRRPGPTATPRDAPVRTGSPLDRLLRMIAREIAKDDPEERPTTSPDDAPEETRPGA